jgi:phage terminase large subunit
LRKVGVYYYIFPTFAQAKRVIWTSITNQGEKFLDYIPRQVLDRTNSQEMSIYFKNGSLLQLVGSDNYDALMGTNPQGVVFSEYALQDPRAYQFIRPILTANDGFAVFISTPRGKNHLFELYQIAESSPHWFAYKMTVEETGHIPLSEIEKEKAEGIMSDDLIQQEYYCSFDLGVEGSYYAKYLDRMRLKGQIGMVPFEAGFKVHVSIDIGVRDSTTLLFFQVIGQTVRIIDCYENSKVGLEHYVKVIEQKPYSYGKFIAPHDIKVQEWGSGLTRIEKARQLGIHFTIAPDLSIEDGIEAVRSALSKIWIDEQSCKPLIKAIENYRQEYDARKKIYKSHPLHDQFSHFADALRYMCISLPKTRDGLSADELDKRYAQAVYGPQSKLPSVFRDDLPGY